MKLAECSRYALGISAAVLLAGCGTPTNITYMYSFNNGLSAGERMGAAYNPRSKE